MSRGSRDSLERVTSHQSSLKQMVEIFFGLLSFLTILERFKKSKTSTKFQRGGFKMAKRIVVELGNVEQIAIGQGQCFIINGQEIALFRSRLGKIFAIENKCPHRGGPLSEGIVGNGVVLCPLPGHKFDLATGQGGEGHECVRSYKVWQEDNRIVMEWPMEGDGIYIMGPTTSIREN